MPGDRCGWILKRGVLFDSNQICVKSRLRQKSPMSEWSKAFFVDFDAKSNFWRGIPELTGVRFVQSPGHLSALKVLRVDGCVA